MEDLFGTQEMRALSWKEPFATLMLYDKIETRTWSTKYRGLVLICASKTPYSFNQVIAIGGVRQYARIQELFDKYNPRDLCGNAIAVGTLVDCRPMTSADEDQCFVQYNEGLFCHIYKDIRPIEPVLWKGAQGWRKVPQEFIDKIQMK